MKTRKKRVNEVNNAFKVINEKMNEIKGGDLGSMLGCNSNRSCSPQTGIGQDYSSSKGHALAAWWAVVETVM